ncbi:unnamed protein product [Citrullus colocynthis]|uniref:HORMA domain-containing protein n=1 Tax=Citrullus colocynthis TaxID=252529 RepID=A0ABP0Y7Y3_9ROSI
MASKTATKDIITLRGSAAIVSEFFGYAANSILYNRGLYPEESFVRVKKYGLPMLLTQDEGVKTFISNLTAQLSEWLEAGKLQRVVLVIMSKSNNEVLERWNFRIETDGEVVEQGVSREKSDKEIMREIQAIMRQIASSITYLPCLDEPCVFDVLAYTDKDLAVPFTWMESDPKLIANPQMVKLHSFDTKIHKVDTLVSYKNDDCDDEILQPDLAFKVAFREKVAEKKEGKRRMGLDGGLSWADQWDNNPDPPPSSSSENEKKKKKDGSSDKSKFRKTILGFKWMKEFRKKSDKS